jgi:hypothetical protein
MNAGGVRFVKNIDRYEENSVPFNNKFYFNFHF